MSQLEYKSTEKELKMMHEKNKDHLHTQVRRYALGEEKNGKNNKLEKVES